MKFLFLLPIFAALLVTSCGKKPSSEGSESGAESAGPSADAAKPAPTESPVAESPSEAPSESPDSLSDADVERLLKEAVDYDSLVERGGLFYQNNELYNGWAKYRYDSGQGWGLEQLQGGKNDGPYTGWYENGQKKEEGIWKDGKLSVTTVWLPNGAKCPNTKFENGTGKVYGYWVDGQKGLEATYKDGQLDGPFTLWHENGQKKEEEIWKDGKPDGPITEWHENGQKKEEGIWKDGKLDGPFTFWHENGQKMAEETYKNDELISAKYWNSEGEEVEAFDESSK